MVVRRVGEEGRDLAEAVGDRFVSRLCRFCLGAAQLFHGDLVGAAAQFGELVAEAQAAHDVLAEVDSLAYLGVVLAWQGDARAARATADAAIEAGAEVGGIYAAVGYAALAGAALAAGDAATARDACEAWPQLSALSQTTAMWRVLNAWAALAGGDLVAARCWADEAVTGTTGYFLSVALLARAQVAIAQGQPDQGRHATPTTRSRVPPTLGLTCTSPTSSNASPVWPATPAVIAKPCGSSEPHTPSGNGAARSG